MSADEAVTVGYVATIVVVFMLAPVYATDTHTRVSDDNKSITTRSGGGEDETIIGEVLH